MGARNRVWNSYLEAAASLTLIIASSGGVKRLSRAAGISPSRASRWRRGESPLGVLTKLLWHLSGDDGDLPEAIVSHVDAVVRARRLETIADADSLLRAMEQVIYAKRDMQLAWGDARNPTNSLEELRIAATRMSGVAAKIAAMCLACEASGVNPLHVSHRGITVDGRRYNTPRP